MIVVQGIFSQGQLGLADLWPEDGEHVLPWGWRCVGLQHLPLSPPRHYSVTEVCLQGAVPPREKTPVVSTSYFNAA